MDMKRVHVEYGIPITSTPIKVACTPKHNAVMGRNKSYTHASAPCFLVCHTQWAHMLVTLRSRPQNGGPKNGDKMGSLY